MVDRRVEEHVGSVVQQHPLDQMDHLHAPLLIQDLGLLVDEAVDLLVPPPVVRGGGPVVGADGLLGLLSGEHRVHAHGVVVRVALVVVLGHLHGLQVHLDAHLGELILHDLGALHVVTGGADDQLRLEAVGVAGLGEEALGLLRIELRSRRRRQRPRLPVGGDGAGHGQAPAAAHDLDELFRLDGGLDGLAHLLLGEGGLERALLVIGPCPQHDGEHAS